MNTRVVLVGVGGMGELLHEALEKATDIDLVGVVAPSHRNTDIYYSDVDYALTTQKDTDVVVDFSTAAAANVNVPKYIEHAKPFVIGTTGWDFSLAKNDKVPCVVAPNMSKTLVALQAAIEYMRRNFDMPFDGFDLRIDESHQSSKEGPSGTATDWGKLFAGMGADAGKMRSFRDREDPHGYHTYDMIKGSRGRDATRVALITEIDGRNEYIEGTLDAVRFLDRKAIAGGKPVVYSMIDVIRKPKR